IRVLRTYSFPPVEVESDSLSGTFGSVMLANVGELAVGSVTRRSDPRDGQLEIVATLPRALPSWCLGGALASFDLYDRCPRVERARASRIRIAGRADVPLQIDGEPFGHAPVEVEARKGAIRLVTSRP
ncbi:MAG TPA: hypothetical protein VGR00_14570, partial [Thermoanaerobaculia bacterium]|nr:hypothetical protein [Thermoanaerobaculia bacterium]